MSTHRWMYDHFDMPSGDGKPSRADKLWARQQEALRQQGPVPGVATCHHCGRPLLLSETDYCTICAIDISQEKED